MSEDEGRMPGSSDPGQGSSDHHHGSSDPSRGSSDTGKGNAGVEKFSVAASGSTGPDGQGGYNAGMAVFSYIIGGIVVWSLIGWGLDILLGTHWIVLAGAFAGLVGGFYLAFARRLTRSRNHDAAGPAQGAGDSGQQ